MAFRLLKNDIDAIIADAVTVAERDGNEICGFLVDNGFFLEVVKTRNKTNNGGGFSYYQKDVEKLEKAVAVLGHEIVGTYHSHPYSIAKPGDSDISSHEIDDLLLVIDCDERTAKLWKVVVSGVIEIPYQVIE